MKTIAFVAAVSVFIGAEALALPQNATPAASSEAAPAASSEVSADSVKAQDEIRCRRIAVTGSLARKTKICKSNAEWARIDRRENDEARKMLERNLEGSSTNGN